MLMVCLSCLNPSMSGKSNSGRTDVESPIQEGDAVEQDLTLEKTVTQGGLDHRRDTPFSQEQLEAVVSKARSTPRDQTTLPREDTIAA